MKKDTNWITVPEDSLHAAIPSPKEGGVKTASKHRLRNNIFYGVTFTVLVAVVFALLAPNTFNSLLKGNLFDTSDIPKDSMKLSIVPKSKKSDTKSTDTTSTTTSTATTSDTTSVVSDATTSDTTSSATGNVKAEEKAVSIVVDPVSSSTSTTKDCKKDMSCFLPYFKDCSLAKCAYTKDDMVFDLEITGSEDSNCSMKLKITKATDDKSMKDLASTEATCKIPKGTYTKKALDTLTKSDAELKKQIDKNYCTGTAVTGLKKYLDDLKAAATTSSDSKTVADLKDEIKKLKEQAALSDLTNKDQDGLKPAASSTTVTKVDSTTSTSTDNKKSTTTVTSPTSTVTPGFKVNPYKVTVTPQEMLKKNTAGGVKVLPTQNSSSVTSSNLTPIVTSINSTTTVNAVKTPNSGPSEVLLIAFIVTFLGLVGWKFRRIFA